MVDKIKDVPSWAKYAAVVIITVVGTVWTVGEIKGSFMVNDALADQLLQSHEKKLETHDSKLDNHEARIDTIESTQTLITSSQDRIEDKVDKQCDKVDALKDEFHKLDNNLVKLTIYLESIESIEDGKESN